MLICNVSVVVNDVVGKSTTVVNAVDVIVLTVNVGPPNDVDELAVVNASETPDGTPANVNRICVPFVTMPAD
jgi:hypothetical protein